jgi:hypothetical protein
MLVRMITMKVFKQGAKIILVALRNLKKVKELAKHLIEDVSKNLRIDPVIQVYSALFKKN